MELEILKNKDIESKIEKELTITPTWKFVSVSNESELAEAEKQIDLANSHKKGLLNKIKPLKQAIDDFKGKFLSKEKIESAKVESFVSLQDAEIKKYKARKLEEQKKLKEEADRKAREEAERIRKEQEAKLQEERKAKQAELDALKMAEGTAKDKLEKAFELTDKINDLNTIVIPEIQIAPEKVVLKKDEVKTKKVFFITDEKAFIEWALQNDRTILKIEISTSAFNSWVKEEKNQLNEYISFREEIL